MTSELPARVPPRTPREPQLPDRVETVRRQEAPPAGFLTSRSQLARAFRNILMRWSAGTASETDLAAFVELAELAEELSDGSVTGQEVIEKLA